MRKYEAKFLWEAHWAIGIWLMPKWYGMQIAKLKIIISEKCELIEPIKWPKETDK